MKIHTGLASSMAPWALSLLRVSAFALGSVSLFAPALAKAESSHDCDDLKTLTMNLYVGADTQPVLSLDPTDPNYLTNLVTAVTGVYYEIQASQPQVRLQAVANKIAHSKPDIVALQEVSLIRNQSPGDLVLGGHVPATHVVFDYLQILLDDLAASGAHYAVASSEDEFDVELPMLNLQTGSLDDARLTDRDVILVRTDLPHGEFRTENPRQGHYVNVIPLPSLGLSVTRGWCSIDVVQQGKHYRFICTHLEEETFPQLQILQAQELLSGPAAAPASVVIAGDFNADALHRDGTTTYDTFISAGYTNAWVAVHRHDVAGGLTWGHDEFLANPAVTFDRRIDHVFYRGKFIEAEKAEVHDLTLGRSTPPLWASDHAGVSAVLELKNH